MSRGRRILIAAGAGGILLLGAAWGLVGTTAGARWLADRMVPAQVQVSGIEGRLIGPLRAGRVRYSPPGTGMRVRVDSVALEWAPLDLLHGTVSLRSLTARRVSMESDSSLLRAAPRIPRPEPALRDLERLLGRPIRPPLPLALRLDRFELGRVVVRSPDFPEPVDAGRVRVRGRADRSGAVLRELSVAGPAVDLTAEGRFRPDVSGGGRIQLRAHLSGRLPGRPPVAADLLAEGTTERVDVRLTTTEPLVSRLTGRVTEIGRDAEWQLEWSADTVPVREWTPDAPLRAVSLSLEANGSLRRESEVTIDTRATPVRGPPLAGRARARLAGDSILLDSLRVEAIGAPGAVEASGSVTLADGSPRVRLRGGWSDAAWPLEGAPVATSDSGRFALAGTRDSVELGVSASASVPRAGPFRAELDANVAADSTIVRRLVLQASGTRGVLRASGAIRTGIDPPSFRAAVAWSNLSWPFRGDTAVATTPSGRIHLSGTPEDVSYRVDADAVVQEQPVGIAASGRMRPRELSVASLRLETLGGTITGSGRTALPDGAWSARLDIDSLDPEALTPAVASGTGTAPGPGRVSLRLRASGTRTADGIRGTVRLDSVRGQMRGDPVEGGARLGFDRQEIRLDSLLVGLGTARLTATGRIGDRVDLTGELRVPNLTEIDPALSGSAALQFSAEGQRSDPLVSVSLRGDSLVARGASDSLRLAELDGSGRWRPYGGELPEGALIGRGLGARSVRVDSVSLRASGDGRDTRLRLQAQGPDAGLLVTATGRATEPGWAGRLDTLSVAGTGLGTWQLREPFRLGAGPDSASVERFCLSRATASLCGEGSWSRRDGGRWAVNADSLPLELVEPWIPVRLDLGGGDVRISASGTVDTAGAVRADLSVGGDGLTLRAASGSDTLSRTADSVRMRGRLEPSGAAGELDVSLADGGRLAARLEAGRENGSWDRVDGRLSVDLLDGGLTGAVVPALSSTGGRLGGELRVHGEWPRPTVEGTLTLEDGRADVVSAGLALREIRLRAADAGPGALRLTGGLRSGPGTVDLEGTVSMGDGFPGDVDLRIQGEQLEVLNTAALWVLVSPDLRIAGDAQGIAVTGRIGIPRARITPRRLEPPVPSSPDVVVAGRDEGLPADTATPLFPAPPVRTDVEVSLGDRVSVEAFGLRGRLTGDLQVTARPDRPPTGRGEIQIEQGRYLAFQRSLQIDRGRLIFAGTPLEDPGLDLRITRRTTGVEVGMSVSGTARSPRFTLFSSPPMSETDLLSYLLFGRPVAAVSRLEGSVLRDALQGVGLVGGEALAARLGTALGLEESRLVTENGRATSLVLGTQISPRLTLGYSIGLFGVANVLRISYRIGTGWVVQAESGGGAGADIMYIIER